MTGSHPDVVSDVVISQKPRLTFHACQARAMSVNAGYLFASCRIAMILTESDPDIVSSSAAVCGTRVLGAAVFKRGAQSVMMYRLYPSIKL